MSLLFCCFFVKEGAGGGGGRQEWALRKRAVKIGVVCVCVCGGGERAGGENSLEDRHGHS